MFHRILLLTVTAACISAYLIGTAVSLATDLPFFALFAIAFPVIGAWLVGLRNPDRLTLIGVYALVGWVLGYWLAPQVAGIRGVNFSVYFSHYGYFEASIVSMLLALVGAAFAPSNQLIPLGKRGYARAALAIVIVGILIVPAVRYLQTQPAKSLARWVANTPRYFQYDIDNPPEGVNVDEWKLLVNSTADAVRECFSSPDDITDRPRFQMLCYDIRSNKDKESLAHIWDEIEQISTRGKEYSAKHRPAALSR